MDKEVVKKAKEAIILGRKNGRVLNISKAFDKYPVINEVHKGKPEYFKNEGTKQ